MARNGSGAYSLPAGNPVVTGTTISSVVQNNTMTDIGTALTQSLAYDGQTNPVANLPMAGFKHTGVANAAARTDYAAAGQVQNGSFTWAGTAGGTANALTLTLAPAITAYSAGQRFVFKAGASPNSAATTVAISGLAAIAVQVNSAACVGGEIAANLHYEIVVDASLTSCQLSKIGRATLAELGAAKSGVNTDITSLAGHSLTGALNEARATVASHATTADIWGALGNSINWTGTATTTTFPAAPQAGAKRRLHCAGACSFTHSATLDIIGNANFTAAASDIVDVEAITTTTFRLIPIKDNGTAVVVAASGKTIGQIVTSAASAVATGTTLIPFDDTIPQNTAGDQYMSATITPQNASSTLVIDVVIASISSSALSDIIAALFQDSVANALAAAVITIPTGGYNASLKFTHIMTAGTTSATTFKVRAGSSAGTTTFNGQGSARRFGGVAASRITITEILP